MASSRTLLLALFVFAITLAIDPNSVEAKFSNSVYFYWGGHHSFIYGNGDDLQLTLDKTSGHTKFQWEGSRTWKTKIIPVLNLCSEFLQLSSTGDRHDEIDFEFLGNVSGQPYTIHTNVYTEGNGTREQQFKAWFDPTADYHNYTIHWNPTEIVWYVDSIPIRVFRNYENRGIAYPNKQGMRTYSSLWNADDWATQGGRVKTDWRGAPFIARYRNFRARACKWFGPSSISLCAAKTPANWWSSPAYSQLSSAKQGQMKWVRDNHMIYDYCKDTLRFHGQMPPECSLPQY